MVLALIAPFFSVSKEQVRLSKSGSGGRCSFQTMTTLLLIKAPLHGLYQGRGMLRRPLGRLLEFKLRFVATQRLLLFPRLTSIQPVWCRQVILPVPASPLVPACPFEPSRPVFAATETVLPPIIVPLPKLELLACRTAV